MKYAKARVSILSRGGTVAGVAGSSNELCAMKRELYRDASMCLHMNGTVDVIKFNIVKTLFPDTAGKYAGND